ncbi:MAG: glycosyltransferase family 4 protein [Bacteroidota bacterium]
MDNTGSITLLNSVFKNNIGDDFEIIPFYTDREKGKTKLSEFNFTNLAYFKSQQNDLKKLIRKHKPDVFHFSMHSNWSMEKSLALLTTAKKSGVKKTIAHLHGGSFEKFWKEMNPIRRAIAKRLFKNVDIIIVASTYWKDFFKKNGFTNHIKIVNNPINQKFVERVNLTEQANRNSKFLFIGSLGKRKGTYDLLKLAERNKKIKLTLIGNSEKTGDFERLDEIIKEKKLNNVELIKSDRLPIDDKVNYFRSMGCFIFPSHIENFPLVIIEAAAAGMPIIATPVGALPEFFEHDKNIIFIEPGNLDQINSAVEQVMSSPLKAVGLGQNANRVFNQKLNLPIIIEQLKQAYKTILNKC